MNIIPPSSVSCNYTAVNIGKPPIYIPPLYLCILSFLIVYSKKVQTTPRKLVSFTLYIVVLDPLWAMDDMIQNKFSLYSTALVTFICAFRYCSGHVVIISFTLILSSEFSIPSLLGSLEICYSVPMVYSKIFSLVILIIRVTISHGSDHLSDNIFVVIPILLLLLTLILDRSPCPEGVRIVGRWCYTP